ncbi:MAG TPA: DUF6152 family protein [Steroidobacteraceae bacterium]|nr:DUF6152 family protein [Steroidobacteraceae bacterium]
MKSIVALALGTSLSCTAAPVLAHHSTSMFEPGKTVTVTGVIKQFQYINPHSWLIIEVVGADHAVTTWSFEAEGPQVMMRAGIRKGDLLPGTRITVSGHPMRDGRHAAAWIRAVRADGKVFDPQPSKGH